MSQSNLTDAEATKYAENYILYGDQTRAFRAAFPDSKAKAETLNQQAVHAHKQPKVCQRIDELRAISKKQSDEEFSLSVGEIKRLLAMAAKSGLNQKIDAQGNKVSHSIAGAVSALAEINKMDGNHYSDKQDAPKEESQVTKIEVEIIGANAKD